MSKRFIDEVIKPERNAVPVLYHASPIQGLTQIVPRVGTHGRAWVYATPDVVIASLFLGRLGGDLTCQIGTLGAHPYVMERFVGAFALRYDIGAAWLYRLSAEGFASGKTSWRQDWVSEQPVLPLQEIIVDDVRTHLLGFVDEGRLALHRCDDAGSKGTDQEADAELVSIFVKLYARGGDKVLAHVTRYYPHLLQRVVADQK